MACKDVVFPFLHAVQVRGWRNQYFYSHHLIYDLIWIFIFLFDPTPCFFKEDMKMWTIPVVPNQSSHEFHLLAINHILLYHSQVIYFTWSLHLVLCFNRNIFFFVWSKSMFCFFKEDMTIITPFFTPISIKSSCQD